MKYHKQNEFKGYEITFTKQYQFEKFRQKNSALRRGVLDEPGLTKSSEGTILRVRT